MRYAVLDLLRKRDMVKREALRRTLAGLSHPQIVDTCLEIAQSLSENDLQHTGRPDESIFNFTASPSSVGFGASCLHPDCKLERVADFVRYATLYADTVAIPNVFPKYAREGVLTSEELDFLRLSVTGDILVLLELAPLFEAGIASFVPPSVGLCQKHGAMFEEKWRQIDGALVEASNRVSLTVAKASKVEFTVSPEAVTYSYSLTDQFFDNDFTAFETAPPPEWLTRTKKYRKSLRSGQPSRLEPEEIVRLDVIRSLLLHLVPWARMYLFSGLFTHSKFLTNRPADALLLEAALPTDELRLSNRALVERMPLQMPILEGVPTQTLLEVRRSDYDAFLNFRTKIMEVQREYRARDGVVSPQDASKIYEHIVFPAMQGIESKLESLANGLRSTSLARIAIVAGAATIGLSIGLLPGGTGRALELAAACEIVDSAVDIWKSTRIPVEVRQDPFFFLWKVSRKTRH